MTSTPFQAHRAAPNERVKLIRPNAEERGTVFVPLKTRYVYELAFV
jgi:hypothetical protein